MKRIHTIAVGTLCVLAVGAGTATADSLITGAKIKNGTVAMRDLTPGVQALIKKHAKDGVNGTNGRDGAAGVNGTNGRNGAAGVNGTNGRDGANGKDAAAYARVTSPSDGEVSVADGKATLSVTDQYGYAGVRVSVKNTRVSDLSELSFKANASDEGVTWLKVTTTGNGSIVFSPNTQPGGEHVGEDVTYNVLDGSARFNDDKGIDADMTWDEIVAAAGDRHVKDVTVYAGYAGPLGADGAATTQIDDLTVNGHVIDFE